MIPQNAIIQIYKRINKSFQFLLPFSKVMIIISRQINGIAFDFGSFQVFKRKPKSHISLKIPTDLPENNEFSFDGIKFSFDLLGSTIQGLDCFFSVDLFQ